MTAITLDYHEALALLNRAVDEKGADYVYVDQYGTSAENGTALCEYFHLKYAGDDDEEIVESTPGCIVGHVLYYKGADPDYYEGDVRALVREGTLIVDSDRTMWLLKVAQEMQDKGAPWGNSVQIALKETASD